MPNAANKLLCRIAGFEGIVVRVKTSRSLSWVLALTLQGATAGVADLPSTVGIVSTGTEVAVGSAWRDDRNPIRRLWSGGRLDLWSLQPPSLVVPTRPKSDAGDSTHPIDVLIHARQISEEISMRSKAAPADRRTLLRRLSYDLTGLAPTAEEVRAFESDLRTDAWERCVDRLLGSPRYGEHQARLWLDVVRYSDSNGFDWDEFRKEAWRFRDYVIRSFNADKPFDQFVVEQLAGDELVTGAPRTEAERDCLIATGYLRMGPHDNAAPLFNEQDRSRAELMADLVETTTGAFLGMTFSCCRCHDHKTEPISHEDHYRFRAFFEGVAFADKQPLELAHELEELNRHNQSIDARMRPLEEDTERILGPVRQRLQEEKRLKLSAQQREVLELPKEKRTKAQQQEAEKLQKSIQPDTKAIRGALSQQEVERVDTLEKTLAEIRALRRSPTHGLLMTDAQGTPPATKVLFQGNHKSPRNEVVPGFLSVFEPGPAELQPALNGKTTGRRLTLARWIASPANPLTARVFVNRVWQQHFGVGLVATPNDFGLSGARPSHPQLLDWLADEFVRSGWSVKKLHRRLVTSATYQLAAYTPKTEQGGDDQNPWLLRQNPRRLSAEQLRDSLLQVSGLLNDRSGGPPVWPELPSEILTANPAFLDDNETRTKGWYPSPPDQLGARSVFLVQKRTVRVPFMETFDLPENSTSCARRTDSTVAPQALSLLNSPLAVEVSRAFAARIQREAGERPTDQIRRAFQLAFQRDPSEAEVERCLGLLKTRSLPELTRAVLNLNEFVYLD